MMGLIRWAVVVLLGVISISRAQAAHPPLLDDEGVHFVMQMCAERHAADRDVDTSHCVGLFVISWMDAFSGVENFSQSDVEATMDQCKKTDAKKSGGYSEERQNDWFRCLKATFPKIVAEHPVNKAPAPPVPASDDPILPYVDMTSWCRKIHLSNRKDNTAPDYMKKNNFNSCVAENSYSYSTLKEYWSILPSQIKKTCMSAFKPGEMSYLVVLECVYPAIPVPEVRFPPKDQ